MNFIRNWLKQRVAPAALLGILAMVGGHANADTYNIVLKQNDTPLSCAPGGFTFTKTVAGSFPLPTTPSPNFSVTAAANCIDTVAAGTAYLPAINFNTGRPNAIVQNVVMNGEPQGPNVEGLAGDVTNGVNGTNRYTLRLAYTGDGSGTINRTFTILKGQGQPQTVATGTYYFRNTKNGPIGTVPEPETPLLMLAGVGALALVRLLKRRTA